MINEIKNLEMENGLCYIVYAINVPFLKKIQMKNKHNISFVKIIILKPKHQKLNPKLHAPCFEKDI
jgi:hypothetical protein